MIVYRLTKKKYRNDLSGKGAELFGGRWNPIGVPALYSSESRALCILEFLAHTPKNIIPPKIYLLSIEVPERYYVKFEVAIALPSNWNSLETNELTQEYGRLRLQKSDCLGFIVPSAIIEQEKNIILNPICKIFDKIKIVDSIEVNIDERLVN